MRYRTPELSDLLGVSFRQLDYWAHLDVVRPTIDAAGSGSRRLWSDQDARLVAVVAALRTVGAPTDVLRAVARQMAAWQRWDGTVMIEPSGRLAVGKVWRAAWVLNLANVIPPKLRPSTSTASHAA